MIEGGELSAFVRDVYRRRNERELWELYLLRFRSESFEEFKKSIKGDEPIEGDGRPAPAAMTEAEIVAQTYRIAGLTREVNGE